MRTTTSFIVPHLVIFTNIETKSEPNPQFFFSKINLCTGPKLIAAFFPISFYQI